MFKELTLTREDNKPKTNSEDFFTIRRWMVDRMGLSGHELIVYALIYSSSLDRENYFCGSLKSIGKLLSISKPTVIRTLKSLVTKGLIEKHSEMINKVVNNKYRAVR